MNTCLKYFFVVFNLLFVIAGAICLGFAFWLKYVPVVSDVVTLSQLNHIVFYSALSLGAVLFIIGLCGALGACYEKKCVLVMYLCIMVIFMLLEVAAIIYSVVTGSGVFIVRLGELWIELNNETKFIVQDAFNCCGYTNSTEWGGNFDQSCINTTITNSTTPWSEPCSASVLSWFRENIIAIGAALVVVVIIQLLQAITTGLLLRSNSLSNQIEDDSYDETVPKHIDYESYDSRPGTSTTYSNPAYNGSYSPKGRDQRHRDMR